MSQASRNPPDPLSDIFGALGARVTRNTRLEAGGEWALAFPDLDRLKFVAVLEGRHWMLLPGLEPQLMETGDVCLLGRTPYTVASDPGRAPIDGTALYDGTDVVRIGAAETIGIGGTVAFAGANADFLPEMLPRFSIIRRGAPGSGAISTLLALMHGEIGRDTIGGELVRARLADLLLVEAIRAHADHEARDGIGWLGALLDPRLGRALRAIHRDVAHPWTVANLAAEAGMSRAAFAAEFRRRIGQPPLSYIRAWRLTRAQAALGRGDVTGAEISRAVGYNSHSAFSQAFRQAFGRSPKSLS